MGIGLDAGTFNLVTAIRADKDKISFKKEVNAYLEIPLDDRFVFTMMKNSGVPLIERDNVAYALGDSAVRMAYSIDKLKLKRPMADGCVNPKEKDAFQILKIMLHGMLDNCVKQDKETVCFSVPANAVNQETDAAYHTKILEAIFKAYKSKDGFTVTPRPINEALAINYAELAHKAHTGVSISFGSGQVNVCYAMYGNPLFTFSIVNSGDWIDSQAAKATGESPVFISKEKCKIDLAKEPTTLVERAIQTQYRIMIENTVAGIKKGFQDVEKSIRSDEPVDFVISGGTSTPNGFTELFEETLKSANLSIKSGKVFRTADTLTSVAKGCLVAAEMN